MTLEWLDPQKRTKWGRKRHVYRETGDQLVRVCGTPDGGSMPVKGKDQLVREEGQEFANDPNACDTCLSRTGYDKFRDTPTGGGAESVEYDPFGVFRDGESE